MLKSTIAILIAGGLLGAQVTVAAAQDIPLRFADDGYQPLPAQEKYFAQRAVSDPKPTGASGPAWARAFIPGGVATRLPAQDKYLEQRAASAKGIGASGGVFGTDCLASADDTHYWNALPAQARYFR